MSEKSEKAYLFFLEYGGLKTYGRFIGSPSPFVVRANSYQEAAAKIGAAYDRFGKYHKATIPFESLKPKAEDPNTVEYTAGGFHLERSRQYITYGITIFMKEVVAEEEKTGFVFTKEADGIHVYPCGYPEIRGCGKTPKDAVATLIRSYPHLSDTYIVQLVS